MGRPRGKLVALGLVALCVAGVWGTIRNYSALHETTSNARVVTPGPPVLVTAVVNDAQGIHVGRHATVSFLSEPERKWSGSVTAVTAPGTVTISLPSGPETQTGAAARVTIDTTPGM
ncbi:MAG: hypothetical protein SFU53_01200 [Terrimicrobiaceae bacterium]|nr:hypothetical protein [Terrimicrobiaceae bacterium]